MKKIFLLSFIFISGFISFSQENTLVKSPKCIITGVLNNEKAEWETQKIKIGLNKSTAEFNSLINFDDFNIQNKETGELIKFKENVMRIYGQIPLSDIMANSKTQQTYKADLTIDFGDKQIHNIFTIEITYISKHYKAVRMYSDLSFSMFNSTPPEGFEDNINLELRFQLYKFTGYY